MKSKLAKLESLLNEIIADSRQKPNNEEYNMESKLAKLESLLNEIIADGHHDPSIILDMMNLSTYCYAVQNNCLSEHVYECENLFNNNNNEVK